MDHLHCHHVAIDCVCHFADGADRLADCLFVLKTSRSTACCNLAISKGHGRSKAPQTLTAHASTVEDDLLAQAMRRLSAELRALFVQSDFATTFNAPTNIDLRLQARMNLFDFSGVPQALRGLFYYLTVSNLIRRIRSEGFKKRVLFIDEVYYMSREPMLMQALAEMLKTVRSYGTAVVLADQDLETYLGVEGAGGQSMNAGLDVASGVYIINNTQWVLSFGLKRSAAERLALQYPGAFLPTHVDFLDEMGSRTDANAKGMGVLLYQNRAEMIYMQLRPREAATLLGS